MESKMNELNELKEKYVDYLVDNMDLTSLIEYVRESLHDNYGSMTQTEFTEMVDADEGFLIEGLANG
tara:strand:+ start:3496 stop:3696 length:201 start_codon:yes stop_codon:yes gene_type:complete